MSTIGCCTVQRIITKPHSDNFFLNPQGTNNPVRAIPFEIPSGQNGMLRGTIFLMNIIIKEKKRVLFVAIVPQGYCFGTLFSK